MKWTLIYRLAADAVVLLHVSFVLFVVLGGLLVRWRRRLLWAHLAAVAWGAGIEIAGGVCPLTPLENELRHRGGQAGYGGDFVDRYVLRALYPDRLTHRLQVVLGLAVVAFNAALYASLIWRHHREAPPQR